jgi:predicted enzyme related to lactoylglutathione lyase
VARRDLLAIISLADTISGNLIFTRRHHMAVTGPDFIALQVRDLEASADFYTQRLGLRRAAAAPEGAVVFATAPIPFAIREPAVDLDATDRLGWGVALWLKADDVDAIHDDLVRRGVRIVTAPFDGPFGRTFSFADPDGYVVTLHG